jgi:hypothetical protein
LTPRKSARIKSHPALMCCYEAGARADALECEKRFNKQHLRT